MSNLFYFLGGYFNEDWNLEADDDKGIVALFMKQESREQISQTLAELQELLAQKRTEDDLKRYLFYELHCRYNPTADGLSLTQWLASIADQLALGLQQTPKSP